MAIKFASSSDENTSGPSGWAPSHQKTQQQLDELNPAAIAAHYDLIRSGKADAPPARGPVVSPEGLESMADSFRILQERRHQESIERIERGEGRGIRRDIDDRYDRSRGWAIVRDSRRSSRGYNRDDRDYYDRDDHAYESRRSRRWGREPERDVTDVIIPGANLDNPTEYFLNSEMTTTVGRHNRLLEEFTDVQRQIAHLTRYCETLTAEIGELTKIRENIQARFDSIRAAVPVSEKGSSDPEQS